MEDQPVRPLSRPVVDVQPQRAVDRLVAVAPDAGELKDQSLCHCPSLPSGLVVGGESPRAGAACQRGRAPERQLRDLVRRATTIQILRTVAELPYSCQSPRREWEADRKQRRA